MNDEYLYGMRLRGFSPGAQPMDGFLRRENADDESVKLYGRRYHDIIVYNRELTEKELSDYELDFLICFPYSKLG